MVKRCGRPTKTRGKCRIEIPADDPCCIQHATDEERATVFAERLANREQRQEAYRERRELWEAARERGIELRQAATERAKETGAAATELAEVLIRDYLSPAVPPPLAAEFRALAENRLRYAVADEETGYRPGRVGLVKGELRAVARGLPPTVEQAARAASHDGGVLDIMGKGHWAAGWLYHLTGRGMYPPAPELTAETVGILTDCLKRDLDRLHSLAAQIDDEASIEGITRWATRAIVRAAVPEARPLRELTVPVLRNTRYGRLDVVVWSAFGPDTVVEIDSALNPASAQKLAFARDAGAMPIWVRFGEGRTDAPDGVTVIDLR
jgi:hypothetical protein